jgi:holliday junction DNA helicase RuvA
MIGFLKGELASKQPPKLILNVGGVGYEVEAPMTTFYQLPDVGQATTLHTHLVVREDAQLLYGFYNLQDRSLFRALIKVNGVGPKLALTILSNMNAMEFGACVSNNDVVSLVKMPGVGKKTAERLLIEMRDKLKDLFDRDFSSSIDFSDLTDQDKTNQAIQDAVSALVALGYKSNDATKVIRQLATNDTNSESLIRQALQQL